MGSIPKTEQPPDLVATVDAKQESKALKQEDKPKYDLVPIPPDGGYGWIIVVSVAALSFCSLCGLTTFGVFMVEFVERFNVKKGYVAWIGSIMMSVIAPMGPFLPPLVERFGCRLVATIGSLGLCISFVLTSIAPNVPFLFMSMGFLTGSFACMMYMSGQVIVQNYFHKKRALASSLSILGTAIAMFVWPPLARFLIDAYSWRGASLIIGGIGLHGMIFGALLRPPPVKRVLKTVSQENGDTRHEDSVSERTRCCEFLRKYGARMLMFWGWFFTNAGHILMIAYTPLRADVLGIDKKQGALLLSVVGVVSGVTRVPAGWIGDRPFVTRHFFAGAASTYCGALTVVSLSFRTFPTLLLFMILYGLGGAVYVGLQGACIFDVVGLKDITYGFSILFVSLGISNFVSLPAAGYIYDTTGRPLETVVTFGIAQMVGGICLFLIPFLQRYLRKNNETDDDRSVQL